MKQITSFVLGICLFLSLVACGKDAPTWQEQYDLGLRYLSEGNYEEAILAFEAAIEIDPKQADAYLALAEVYTGQGDVGKAAEILERAVAEIGETARLTAALAAVAPSREPEPAPEMELEQKLYEMLHREGALSYADLPELFFRPCDQLGDLIGCQLEYEGATEQSGGYSCTDSNGVTHDADYILPVRQLGYANDLPGDNYASITFGMAYAPTSSDQLLSLEMEAFGGGDGACSVGWKEIWLGDTYADVLEKLGLDAQVLEEYFYFNVHLSEDGRMNQISADEINPRTRGFRIGFVSSQYINRGGDYTISFEFEDGVHLTHVRYHNFGLLVELTAASATEPTPAPTPAEPNAPEPAPEPTPTPETDLSRTERMEMGDGGYIITEYNSAGQIVSQAFYNADGSVSSRFTKEYDSAGRQIRVTNYGVDGSYSVSEYDASGNQIKMTQCFADGTVDYSYSAEYDSSGSLSRNIWYYADGTVKEVSEFNAEGNEIRRTTYSPDGTVESVLEF